MGGKANTPARFWSKFDKSGDCWLWTGETNSSGYGRICVSGKRVFIHRHAYALTHGDIPNGAVIDHVCHTKTCANPDHLRIATKKQNGENLSGAHSDSSSGVLGVQWQPDRKRWRARVVHNGREHFAGRYLTREEAESAAIAKRNELFTHNDLDRAA